MLVPPAPSQQTAQHMNLEQNPSLNSNSPKSYGNIALTESEVSPLTSLQGVYVTAHVKSIEKNQEDTE